MSKKVTTKQRGIFKLVTIGLVVLGVVVVAERYLSHATIAVLNPKGYIAQKEYNLIIFGTVLSLLIIVPVFLMTFMIVKKYRVDQHDAPKVKRGKPVRYTPDWDHDRRLETIWWGVPLLIIMVLAVVTWQSSHELDPFKAISANVTSQQPIKVQVVALQWKWLFIYPDQGVASVNYLEFPAGTPVSFEITADAPMNSFWIPQLGGQVYAMSGMSTQLHLMADQPGTFRGVSANLSGEGFAGMNFMAHSVSNNDFANWVQAIKSSAHELNSSSYAQLSQPSKDNKPAFYTVQDSSNATAAHNLNDSTSSTDLYDTVVQKYMMHSGASSGGSMDSMDAAGSMDDSMNATDPLNGHGLNTMQKSMSTTPDQGAQ